MKGVGRLGDIGRTNDNCRSAVTARLLVSIKAQYSASIWSRRNAKIPPSTNLSLLRLKGFSKQHWPRNIGDKTDKDSVFMIMSCRDCSNLYFYLITYRDKVAKSTDLPIELWIPITDFLRHRDNI